MLFVILIAIPFFMVAIIYSIFQYDLNHAKGLRKLKHGAVENLIRRHRWIATGHLGLFAIIMPVAIFGLGSAAVVIIILWAVVFMGHMYTLWRFSKQMMATMDMSAIINQRLHQKTALSQRMTTNDEGELVPIDDKHADLD